MSLLEDDDGPKKCEVVFEEVVELTPEQLKQLRDEKDFYSLLGVAESATPEEIAASYKSKALRLHPDKHTHSPHLQAYKEAFETLAIAKRTLSDPQLRRSYDLRRGSSSVKRKWSFEALQEKRKGVNEDYRKIEYGVHLETQLDRAKIYHDVHESDKVYAFGCILQEVRDAVLSEMRSQGWDLQRAAAFASEKIGKPVGEDEVQEWIRLESQPKQPDALSRKELEERSELIDERGRFTGFTSYKDMANFFASEKGSMREAAEVNSAAGAGMKAAILKAREEREAERRAAAEAQRSEAAEKEASKKRALAEADQSLQEKINKKPRLDTAEGFARVEDTAKRISGGGAAGGGGLSGVGASLRFLQKQDEESDSDSGGGAGPGGLCLGGYESE